MHPGMNVRIPSAHDTSNHIISPCFNLQNTCHMIPLNADKMSPYNLHVGDWVYVKKKCFWPVQIAAMDDFQISTRDGDLFSYDEIEPVFISNKTITEFSLPCEGMAIKGRATFKERAVIPRVSTE